MAKKKTKTYKKIAKVNARIGSNEDGSPKLHFQEGKPIYLTSKQVKIYKNYI